MEGNDCRLDVLMCEEDGGGGSGGSILFSAIRLGS